MRVIKFEYINLRGEAHTYEGYPESVELGKSGAAPGEHWVMNMLVRKRDGESRPSRRTFIMGNIRNLCEIEVEE